MTIPRPKTGSSPGVVGDIEGDGIDELIQVLNAVEGPVDPNTPIALTIARVVNGAPTFTDVVLPTTVKGGLIAVFDATNDGRADLLFTDSISIFHGIGNGSGGFAFGAAQPIGTDLLWPSGIDDLDNDGDLDVVVGISASSVAPGFAVLRNNGAGTFQRIDHDPGDGGTIHFVDGVADFNLDGFGDVLTSTGTSTSPPLHALTRTTSSALSLQTISVFPASAIAPGIDSLVAEGIADFDQDGRPDIAFAGTDFDLGSTEFVVFSATNTAPGFVLGARRPSFVGQGILANLDLDNQPDRILNSSRVELDASSTDPNVIFVAPSGLAGGKTLAARDLDLDGFTDLVTVGPTPNTLVTHRGGPSATFLPPIPLATFASNVVEIFAGSFTPDAWPDLFVVTENQLVRLIGSSAGTFTTSGTFPLTASFAPEFGIGKIDNDNYTDVVFAGSALTNASVVVLRGTAFGFSSSVFSSLANPYVRRLALGDVTGDGKSDLITSETAVWNGNSTAAVYPGNGIGSFAAPQTAASGKADNGLVVIDFDHDTRLDVATLSYADGTVQLLRSTGSGLVPNGTLDTWKISLASSLTQKRNALGVSDVTGDGIADLISGVQSSAAVHVLAGRLPAAGGGFVDLGRFTSNDLGGQTVVADVNGDQRPDLIGVGGLWPTAIVVLGNSSGPFSAEYGSGKSGAFGVPRLRSLGVPQLGAASGLRIEKGLPGAVPFLFLGAAPATLPFDLGALLVVPTGPILVLPAFSTAGTLDLALTLPTDPVLSGANVYFQSMHIDPTALGASHTAQSNGLRWTLGL